jgi:hypothetical protein
MHKLGVLIAGLLFASSIAAVAAGPATPATPASPATPAIPGGAGTPASPAVPATPATRAVPPGLGGANAATPAVPATPAIPGGAGTPATRAVPAARATPPSHSAAATTAARTGQYGSAPTCGTSTPADLAAVWGCVSDANQLAITWSDAGLTCEPTKYAVQVTAKYTDLTLVPPASCTVEISTKFTTAGPVTELDVPWDDLQDPPLEFCPGEPITVKVKALTTAPGASNRSQNNAFATATAIGDAAGDACAP